MSKEKAEDWERKLVKVEEKVSKLTRDRNILVNARNKLQEKRDIKLSNYLTGINLQEEISHLQDWIEFYKEKISGYKDKIEALQKEVSQQSLEKVKEEAELENLMEPAEGKETAEKEALKEEKHEIKAGEKLEEDILGQQLEDLDKEYKETAEKEKETKPLKEEAEELGIEIISEDELKRDVEESKAELEERAKVEVHVKELFTEKAKEKKQFRIKEKLELIKESLNIKGKLQPLKNQRFLVSLKSSISTTIKNSIKIKERLEFIKNPININNKLKTIREPINNITKNVFNNLSKLDENKLIKYTLPVVMLLLVVSVLFISKPQITGYVTLTKENTYDDNLGLVMNESGNYTWTIDNAGDIKSIKATGSVKGNGTVKIYIEKDGERYLIYDNKKG